MGKLDTVRTLVEIVKNLVDAGVAIADARRRAREEEEKRKAIAAQQALAERSR